MSIPYVNDTQLLEADYVAKVRSREAMHSMKSNRENFQAKWNKKLVQNMVNNANFKHSNVGASHLTAPLNYSKQPEIKTLMRNNKDKVMDRVKGYQSPVKALLPIVGEGDMPQTAHTAKKKSAKELRIDSLAKTFTSNFPGELKNGRELKEPEYQRIAFSLITTPTYNRSPRNEGNLKSAKTTSNAFHKTNSMFTSPETQDDQAWKNTMTT